MSECRFNLHAVRAERSRAQMVLDQCAGERWPAVLHWALTADGAAPPFAREAGNAAGRGGGGAPPVRGCAR